MNEIGLCREIELSLRENLIARISNLGDFILVKMPNGRLFKISCSRVEK